MDSTYSSTGVGTICASLAEAMPADWLLCDGSKIPTKYSVLIALVGTNTPNLIGRTLIGAGAIADANTDQDDGMDPGFSALGDYKATSQNAITAKSTGGECCHTLSTDEMPEHTHNINGGEFYRHHRSFEGEKGDEEPFHSGGGDGDDTLLKGTNDAGGSGSHNNLQPYYVVDYYIYAGVADS